MMNFTVPVTFAVMLLLSSLGKAQQGCPFVTKESIDAIDSALPCTNFADLDGVNLNSSLQSDLVPRLRQGVYSELVQRNRIEADCRARVFNQKIANNAEMESIYNEIADRFVRYRPALRSLRGDGQRDRALTQMSQGPRGEAGESSARGAQGLMQGVRDGRRNAQRDQLIARIPYGFEPQVADTLRQLDAELHEDFPRNQAEADQFRQRIRAAFVQTEAAYSASVRHFDSLWRDLSCATQESNGVGVLSRTVTAMPATCGASSSGPIADPADWQSCRCPSGYTSVGGVYQQEGGTWRALSMSGSVESLSEELNHNVPRIQTLLRGTLACNGDQYAADREALNSFMIASGAVSVIPGLAPLVVAGISAVVYGDRIIESCYRQATGFRVVNGQSCTNGMSLQSAVQAADSTDCGSDIANAAGGLLFTGAVGNTRRVLSGVEGALGGTINSADNVVAAFAADTGRVADVPAGRSARAGARRGDSATGAGARPGAGRADDAAAAAARGDDVDLPFPARLEPPPENVITGAPTAAERARLRRESLGVHVPSRTRASRLVDNNIDNREVRLTEVEERLIRDETLERKREIDRLIGGREGRDIYDDQVELNTFLNNAERTYEENIEAYIRHRGFTGERARNLRESILVLQRERTVLTRARVNRDLDDLRNNGAEIQTVSCGAANSLNDPAFHDRAKCSVIRFTRAVENYCACGGRGGLGSWAGPCAQAFTDYLTADELVDRDALPASSARNMRECKRLRIPAGTVVVHGGLRPTFSGHGGAAQIYLPTRGLAPRVPRDAPPGTPPSRARLDETQGPREELGITDADITGAQQIEIVAVSPLNPNREVTSIYRSGTRCRDNPGGCTPRDVQRFTDDFNLFATRNPDRVTPEQREQFQEWTEWLRGCRRLVNDSRTSSFSNFDATIPGCRR